VTDDPAIERAITQLVQGAPELDQAVIADLLERLRDVRSSSLSPLALSIARVVELVGEGLVDPGIALPPLAMACATLAAGARGALAARELEAARFEIETLQPVPDRPLIESRVPVDVPLDALRRRSPIS